MPMQKQTDLKMHSFLKSFPRTASDKESRRGPKHTESLGASKIAGIQPQNTEENRRPSAGLPMVTQRPGIVPQL